LDGALTAAPDGTVYVAAHDVSQEFDPRAVIYRYDGRRLEEFFRPAYERCNIMDVKHAYKTLWAVGRKAIGEGYRPYVANYGADRWREIDVPNSVGETSFYKVFPVSPGACWFTTRRAVYKYDSGVWQKKFQGGPGVYDVGIAETGSGRVFVSLWAIYRFGHWKVNVSDDGGATWHEEGINLAEGLYRITDYRNVFAVAGETLYLAVKLKTTAALPQEESKDYFGIIKREPAPAGEGRYELAFLASSSTAPVKGFRAMAFHDAGNGRAVGYLTSVALEHGEWATEAVHYIGIYYSNYEAITACYPYYWAILKVDTYYHNDASYWLCQTR
jgi:hypothetical protein